MFIFSFSLPFLLFTVETELFWVEFLKFSGLFIFARARAIFGLISAIFGFCEFDVFELPKWFGLIIDNICEEDVGFSEKNFITWFVALDIWNDLIDIEGCFGTFWDVLGLFSEFLETLWEIWRHLNVLRDVFGTFYLFKNELLDAARILI